MKKKTSMRLLFVVVALMLAISVLCTTNLAERALLQLKSRAGIPAPLAIRCGARYGAEQPNADGSWSSDKYYMLYTVLPDWASKEDLDIRVEYPEHTHVGSAHEIVITATTGDGELYEGRYQIESSENLRVVYGSADPRVMTGGEIGRDGCTFRVFFTTMPDNQHERYDQFLESRFGWDIENHEPGYECTHVQSGVDGVMRVTFCRL